MLAATTTTTTRGGVGCLAFGHDDALVLDRWIADVCGEEVQFPAHRRSQFEAYKQHLRQLRREAAQTLFRNTTRSGTREIVALQQMLAALRQLHERDAIRLTRLRKDIDSTERVLEDMHTVLVDETTTLPPPPSPPPGNAYGAYQPLDAVSPENTAAYESHRKLAERYVQDLERQRQTNHEQLEQHQARYRSVLEQVEQLQKEVLALRETEGTVVERAGEVREALSAERALLVKEKTAWEELQRQQLYAVDEGGRAMSAMSSMEGSPDEVARLCKVRLTLTDVTNELTQAQTDMGIAESSHAVRFRQSRQRLKDWQDMVRDMRRTCDQLSARTGVIAKVVETTAVRLEEENGNSYMEQLWRLNQVLIEKTAIKLGFHKGEENKEVTAGDVRVLFTHQTQATPSASTTDETSLTSTSPRRLSSISSLDATRMGPCINSPLEVQSASGFKTHALADRRHRHRRGYALLTYLQRWERAILSETSRLLALCEQSLSPTGSPQLSALEETIQQIGKVLLMA